MTARNVSDGVGHGQHGETESERDAQQANPQIERRLPLMRQEFSREHGRTAASERKPEGAEEFGEQLVGIGDSFVITLPVEFFPPPISGRSLKFLRHESSGRNTSKIAQSALLSERP